MKILSIVSKPLDVLNAIEYCHIKNYKKIEFIVVGVGLNQDMAIQNIMAFNYDYRVLPTPDFYYHYISHRRINLKYDSALFKAVISFVSYFSWHILALRIAFSVRNLEFDTVITDAWRDKILFAAIICKGDLVLIDGGQSTKTWNLDLNWRIYGPVKAVRLYLMNQTKNYQKDKNILKIAKYLFRIGSLPLIIRYFIFSKIKGFKSITLFSSYVDIDDVSLSILKNSYIWSSMVMKNKRIEKSMVYIIGYPEMLYFDAVIDHIVSNGLLGLSIEYKAHPRTNMFSLKESVNELKNLPISINESGNTLEFDFLTRDVLPGIVVSYESSALVWIKQTCPQISISGLPFC